MNAKGIIIAIISFVPLIIFAGVSTTHISVQGPKIPESLRNEASSYLDWPLARPLFVKQILSSVTADGRVISNIEAMENIFESEWLPFIDTISLTASNSGEPVATLALTPAPTITHSKNEAEVEFTMYSFFAIQVAKYVVSIPDRSCRVTSG